jgi:hypothetical protein
MEVGDANTTINTTDDIIVKENVIENGELYAFRSYDTNNKLHSKFTTSDLYNHHNPTTKKLINSKLYLEWYSHGICLGVKTPTNHALYDSDGRLHSECDFADIKETKNWYSLKTLKYNHLDLPVITYQGHYHGVLRYVKTIIRNHNNDSIIATTIEYFDEHGVAHKENGPGYIDYGASNYEHKYIVHGKLHRINGPAWFIDRGVRSSYYINGVRYSKLLYWIIIKLKWY